MIFNRPSDEKIQQDSFSTNEVGLSHPEMQSFIRLNDEGDIEIVVSESLAIVLHAKTRSIVFVADNIKFLTKEGDSIGWNDKLFNSNAIDFTEPSLIPNGKTKTVYDGVSYATEG